MKIQNISNEKQIQLTFLFSDKLEYVVEWMIRDKKMARKDAEFHRNEFLKFMSLFILEDSDIEKTVFIPHSYADVFWHEFLLFNNKYSDWTTKMFGKTINHHPGKATQKNWEMTKLTAHKYYNENWLVPGTSGASVLAEILGEIFGEGGPWN